MSYLNIFALVLKQMGSFFIYGIRRHSKITKFCSITNNLAFPIIFLVILLSFFKKWQTKLDRFLNH